MPPLVAMPALVFFFAVLAATGRKWGAALVSLPTFSGLAQFCKKPCNPVFNVLQFFKKVDE
jgi:hypothetical protein